MCFSTGALWMFGIPQLYCSIPGSPFCGEQPTIHAFLQERAVTTQKNGILTGGGMLAAEVQCRSNAPELVCHSYLTSYQMWLVDTHLAHLEADHP